MTCAYQNLLLVVGSSDSLVIETLKRKTRDGELNSTMFET